MKTPTLLKTCLVSSLLVLSLAGCDDDDDTSGEGYIKLYNAAADSPYIYLTLDEDLSSDSDDDDDHYESTYSGVAYGYAHSNIQVDSDNYEYQLAWQDEDSNDVADLEVIHEDKITISDDTIHLVVMSNSILSPDVVVYDIPEIDDDNDSDDDLFNLRALNVSSSSEDLSLYYSEEDETFNEATLVSQLTYQELSENSKVDQDDYIFYITAAGSDEVLFTSESISFYYASQNIMIIRDNHGAGSSPFVLDKMSDSNVIEYVDAESEAKFSVYNAVPNHEKLPTYNEDISFHLNGITDTPIIPSIPYGEASSPLVVESGDYSVDITVAGDNSDILLQNHLFSVDENTNQTIFFYPEEEDVDANEDGVIDEDDEGETEINLYTLAIENSLSTSIYTHEIEIVNLIQSDDFSSVHVYFVRNDENINSALYNSTINYKYSNDIDLPNNTYEVKVVAKLGSSSKLLNAFDLVLDEESSEQFLILEVDETTATGYKYTLLDQSVDEEEAAE